MNYFLRNRNSSFPAAMLMTTTNGSTKSAWSQFGRKLTVAVVAATILGASQSRASLITGLQGYWPFEGDGTDQSGNGRDLTLTVGTTFATGLLGEALSLPGDPTRNAKRPVDDPVFDFGASDFTVQLWVNFNSSSGPQVLLEKFGNPSTGPGWTLYSLGSSLEFYAPPFGVFTTPTIPIQLSAWHQAVIRRSGTGLDMFFDDQLRLSATGSGGIADTSDGLLVGSRDGSNLPTNGRIDELGIWDRALTDAEIDVLWNDGKGTSPVRTPDTGDSLSLLVSAATLLLVIKRFS